MIGFSYGKPDPLCIHCIGTGVKTVRTLDEISDGVIGIVETRKTRCQCTDNLVSCGTITVENKTDED